MFELENAPFRKAPPFDKTKQSGILHLQIPRTGVPADIPAPGGD